MPVLLGTVAALGGATIAAVGTSHLRLDLPRFWVPPAPMQASRSPVAQSPVPPPGTGRQSAAAASSRPGSPTPTPIATPDYPQLGVRPTPTPTARSPFAYLIPAPKARGGSQWCTWYGGPHVLLPGVGYINWFCFDGTGLVDRGVGYPPWHATPVVPPVDAAPGAIFVHDPTSGLLYLVPPRHAEILRMSRATWGDPRCPAVPNIDHLICLRKLLVHEDGAPAL